MSTRFIPEEEVVAEFRDWVENGNPLSEDESDNDLDDLNGPDIEFHVDNALNDDSYSDIDENEDEDNNDTNSPPAKRRSQHPKKIQTTKRLVNSIDASVDLT